MSRRNSSYKVKFYKAGEPNPFKVGDYVIRRPDSPTDNRYIPEKGVITKIEDKWIEIDGGHSPSFHYYYSKKHVAKKFL